MNKDQIKKIESRMWDNITTETLLRKWERRLLVALTKEEREKCLYHIGLYK